MSKTKQLSQLISSLTQAEKVIVVGSLFGIISVVLPWYRDVDAWGKGDTYLGLTGPLSIVGLIVLISSAAVLWNVIGKKVGKEIKILSKHKNLTTMLGGQTMLMFFVAISIYLDPKFGVNITLKETSFGLLLCLAAGLVMFLGGRMKQREPVEHEINIFEEMRHDVERIHQKLHHEVPTTTETVEVVEDEEPLAAKQYREKEETETMQMDI